MSSSMIMMPKSKLSASDFKPFASTSKPRIVPRKKPVSKFRAGHSHELSLSSLFSKDTLILDDESSSSNDESDDDEDETSSSSKPSSSSGRTSSSQNCPSPPVVDSMTEPAVPVRGGEVITPRKGSPNFPSDSVERAKILARMREELFTVPGSATVESSEGEDSVMEASCGSISTISITHTADQNVPFVMPSSAESHSTSVVGIGDSDKSFQEKKKEEKSPSPQKSTHLKKKSRKKSHQSPAKSEEEHIKSKLVNCPVCGKIIIEKTSSLEDHYGKYHTPQRSDMDCLGLIPTHKHADGTAFVRLANGEKISGNQCFICHRICKDPKQLKLHWLLHKVYVPSDDARNISAVSDEMEASFDMMDQFEHVYDQMDIAEPSDEEMWTSGKESTDDESEDDTRRGEFERKVLETVKRMTCRSKRAKKRKPKTESTRRCPDCDSVFTDGPECSQHRLNVHHRTLMYRCVREECRKIFPGHREYREHHRHGHRQRAFICSVCNDHFSIYGQLTFHKRSHKFLANNHKFQCSKCHVAFPRKDMLTNHGTEQVEVKIENTISNLHERKCLLCFDVFDDYKQFEIHVDDHFKKLYCCPSFECKFEADDVTTMRNHLYSHYSLESLSQSLRCPRCHKLSASEQVNQNHCSTCNHQCGICKRTFILEEDLYIHFLKSHQHVTLLCPFCCEVMPSIVENVAHQRNCHLAEHTNVQKEICRIFTRLFTNDNVEYFPKLVSKFPDLANGLYAFIRLGTGTLPPSWKLSEEEKQKREGLAVVKRVKSRKKTEKRPEKMDRPSSAKKVKLEVEEKEKDHFSKRKCSKKMIVRIVRKRGRPRKIPVNDH